MKGQAYIMQLFSLLLTGLLAGSMAFILPGQVTKIAPAMQEKERENMAVIVGNVLLGHPDLIYSEGNNYHRGIFDKGKLDSNLFGRSSGISLFHCEGGKLCDEFTFYPDSYGLVIVYDSENPNPNENGWFSGLFTNLRLSEDSYHRIESCFKNRKIVNELFAENTNIYQLMKLNECDLKGYTTVLNTGFPISIRYSSGETHAGLLKVLVVE